MPDDQTRSRNPVQKVQGYIERGGAPVTTTELTPRLIKTQELLPSKQVRLVFPGTDDPAPMYDRNGLRITDLFVSADDKAFYSFYAETGQYDIRFTEPGTTPPTQIFRLTDVKVESRIFNVRDYGAKGNGVDDDTAAIRTALTTMIAANTATDGVGTLYFPNGRYMVNMNDGPFELPSGILVKGTNSQYSGDGTAGNCQIVLTAANRSIFKIKGGSYKIAIRDIGLTRDTSVAIAGTAGIKAEGVNSNGNVTQVEFHNLTIWQLARGISVAAVFNPAGEPNEPLIWDFTNVKVSQCTIVECNSGIYLESGNCDFWKIVDCRIGANPGGYALHFKQVGIVVIDSVLGAGVAHPNEAEGFLYLSPVHGTVTLISCECEGFLKSIEMAPGPNLEANINWPILLLNNAFGPKIALDSNCDFVSVGNCYLPETVQCGVTGNSVMIFSFGDIIRSNEAVEPNPASDFTLAGNSRIAARANRYRVDFQSPARFGGQAGMIAHRVEDIALAISPFAIDQVQLGLCDPEGVVLFHIRADNDSIYFENPWETPFPTTMMRLDRHGNLTIKGRFNEDPDL